MAAASLNSIHAAAYNSNFVNRVKAQCYKTAAYYRALPGTADEVNFANNILLENASIQSIAFAIAAHDAMPADPMEATDANIDAAMATVFANFATTSVAPA